MPNSFSIEPKNVLVSILEKVAENYDINFRVEFDAPRNVFKIRVHLDSLKIERIIAEPHLHDIIYDNSVALSFMEELETRLDELIRESAESLDKEPKTSPDLLITDDDAFEKLMRVAVLDYIEHKSIEDKDLPF